MPFLAYYILKNFSIGEPWNPLLPFVVGIIFEAIEVGTGAVK